MKFRLSWLTWSRRRTRTTGVPAQVLRAHRRSRATVGWPPTFGPIQIIVLVSRRQQRGRPKLRPPRTSRRMHQRASTPTATALLHLRPGLPCLRMPRRPRRLINLSNRNPQLRPRPSGEAEADREARRPVARQLPPTGRQQQHRRRAVPRGREAGRVDLDAEGRLHRGLSTCRELRRVRQQPTTSRCDQRQLSRFGSARRSFGRRFEPRSSRTRRGPPSTARSPRSSRRTGCTR